MYDQVPPVSAICLPGSADTAYDQPSPDDVAGGWPVGSAPPSHAAVGPGAERQHLFRWRNLFIAIGADQPTAASAASRKDFFFVWRQPVIRI